MQFSPSQKDNWFIRLIHFFVKNCNIENLSFLFILSSIFILSSKKALILKVKYQKPLVLMIIEFIFLL